MYEDYQNDLLREEEKRKAVRAAMLNKPKYNPYAQVSGRTVPYDNKRGWAQIGEALINRGAMYKSDERSKKILADMETERTNSFNSANDQWTGRDAVAGRAYEAATPEINSNYGPDADMYNIQTPATPEVSAIEAKAAIPQDKEQAMFNMMKTGLNPEVAKAMEARLRQEDTIEAYNARSSKGRGNYSRYVDYTDPKTGITRKVSFDSRAPKGQQLNELDGTPITTVGLAPKYTPAVTQANSAAKEQGTSNVQEVMQPKIEDAKSNAAMANPNSPEYKKEITAHSGDYNKYRTLLETKSKVQRDIEYIIDPKNTDGFQANFGGYNARYITSNYPQDSVQNMKARISSVKAAMKAAGKTLATADGTSIGQITEREWPILEEQIAAINPNMGEEGAESSFKDVLATLERMKDTAASVYDGRWSKTSFYNEYTDLYTAPGGVDQALWDNMSETKKKQFIAAGKK